MGHHEGRAFEASLPDGQQGGQVSVSGMGVAWQGESGRIDLPLNGLKIEAGGASNRILYFTHPGWPSWVVTTSDWTILQEPAIASHPAASKLARKARRTRATGWWILGGMAGLLIAAIVALVLARPWIVRRVAAAVPVSVEMSIGEQAAAAFEASQGSTALDDAAVEAGLAELTKPVLDGVGPSRYPFRFQVIDDPSVNAFAMPGGRVVIHSGLILKAESSEEVMGVLAHEIAHVQERHAIRAIVERLGLAALAQLLFGDASGLQGILVASGPELLGLKFSRDFEREADATGFRYLERAGVDPAGMASMFRKLGEEGGSGTLDILSTHPPSEERFTELDRMVRELEPGSSREFSFDFAAFQERIRSLTGQAGP